MSDKPETIAAIIAEARNKYTVHDCNECDYRKSCDLRFDCDECKTKRESISLALGIEDDYFTKLLDQIEKAVDRERAIADIMLAVKDKPLPHHDPENAPRLFFPMTKTQLQTLADLVAIAHDEMDGLPYHERELERFDSLLSDMKARYALDKPYAATGNAAALREALTAFVGYLTQKRIDEVWAKTTLPEPGLDRLVEQARAALAAPARNCDRFQTADEARDAVKAAFANTMLLDDRQLRAVCGWLFAPAEGGDHA